MPVKPPPKEGPSYFQKRMELLGITPEINKIAIWKENIELHQPELVEVPIFTEVEKGIRILVTTLDRETIRIEKNGSRMKEDFAMTRLEQPIEKPNGDVIKYLIPKAAGTQPFFPPSVIEKYEKKVPMKTVYLTEGYFKAFKAAMQGVDIIGLSSITHMVDRSTGKLHGDIIKLITSGLVERFVWLTDGDCLDISSKEITETKDLRIRPNNFFNTVVKFKSLLDDYENIEKWFFHINTDDIVNNFQHLKITRDQVKGIDDLLVNLPDKNEQIINDLFSLSSAGDFFVKFNITYGVNKVYKHFNIRTIEEFFFFHAERRPELKTNPFKYSGTLYKYDENEQKPVIQVPKESTLYFRVGDTYYKWIEKPNQFKKRERTFEERKKTTIIDDHGRTFINHIPKYEAFCNVPDHINFEPTPYNCFNVYSPLEYQPDEEECGPEDCPSIISLVKHIFGERKVSFKDTDENGKPVEREYLNYELGLDYLQLLYQKPQMKLPILCLVSKENSTGKTTFGDLLRILLGANVAIVGNQDISGDFNAHWATKSVVVIDEAKIDKQHVVEKMKMISTAKKIYMNAKGRGQVELDCFIKVIFITNNEDNFIFMTEDDERYWVNKVPVLTVRNPTLLENIAEEIPAFLSFLSRRKIQTELKSRMWFHPHLLHSQARQNVIRNSMPTIVKEIRTYFREMFADTALKEIQMTADDVHRHVLNNKFERNYLRTVLQDYLRVEPYHVFIVEGIEGKEFLSRDRAELEANHLYINDPDPNFYLTKVQKKFKPVRYSFPVYQDNFKEGEKVRELVTIKSNNPQRPYVFKRETFLTKEELAQLLYTAEVLHNADNLEPTPQPEMPVQGDFFPSFENK